ncbi:TetR family transcriptional regulator [Streptomyces sp. NRRL F-4489]|uniref:TetR/AcrR family transcriptional regulator n=1 Tax=Streptomyces sp. NRRL F-4489 TaxID=1609095 RepID=UPI0007494637|nr:TetR/AcrR family transcriptional regulator [Streptomyces sp. NRRL F-4489]KUL50047.1 TetR family transcriptional regulator [Streptomyces sp. NRRL F-4489]
MHIQGSQWPAAVAVTSASDGAHGTNGSSAHGSGAGGTGAPAGAGGRSTPLRVDAQRNLEHVLRAAREVFGELGYGAPMEDVARRARVGVGTVYRRFPSKDVLVRRIAEEETARLTEQARAALGQEDDPWSALARFLRTSVASGAGRLLPPGILRVDAAGDRTADGAGEPRLPEAGAGARVPLQRVPGEADGGRTGAEAEETPGGQALLEVVGRLVERARAAGALRADVTVSDVLLVIATGAPALPDPGQQQAASTRLLEILLEGLRSRAGG